MAKLHEINGFYRLKVAYLYSYEPKTLFMRLKIVHIFYCAVEKNTGKNLPGIQNEIVPAITEKYLLTTRSQLVAEFIIEFLRCSGFEQIPVKTGKKPVNPDKTQHPKRVRNTRKCVTRSWYNRGLSTTAMQRSMEIQPK